MDAFDGKKRSCESIGQNQRCRRRQVCYPAWVVQKIILQVNKVEQSAKLVPPSVILESMQVDEISSKPAVQNTNQQSS
jgi:hypothetical protein